MPKITQLEALRVLDRTLWEQKIREALDAAGNDVGVAARSQGMCRRAFERQLFQLERIVGRLDRPGPGNPNFLKYEEADASISPVEPPAPEVA